MTATFAFCQDTLAKKIILNGDTVICLSPEDTHWLNEQIALNSENKKTCDALRIQCDSLIQSMTLRISNSDNIITNKDIEISNLNISIMNLSEIEKINRKKRRKNTGYLTAGGIFAGLLTGFLIAR